MGHVLDADDFLDVLAAFLIAQKAARGLVSTGTDLWANDLD